MMTGWKTWFGVGVAIITGIYIIVVEGDATKGITLIAGGITALGIAHKIEKGLAILR